MTPEKRSRRIVELQLESARREASLLRRLVINSRYFTEAEQRTIVGSVDDFVRRLDAVDFELLLPAAAPRRRAS